VCLREDEHKAESEECWGKGRGTNTRTHTHTHTHTAAAAAKEGSKLPLERP